MLLWAIVIVSGRLIPYNWFQNSVRRRQANVRKAIWTSSRWAQWPVSQAIGASIWIYPTIQAIHLVFLALFAGGMMITDLRLLGFGMRSKTVAEVARDARPWVVIWDSSVWWRPGFLS